MVLLATGIGSRYVVKCSRAFQANQWCSFGYFPMSLFQLALSIQSAVVACKSREQARDCLTYLEIMPTEETLTDCMELAVTVTDFIQYNYFEEEFPQALEEVRAAVEFALAS